VRDDRPSAKAPDLAAARYPIYGAPGIQNGIRPGEGDDILALARRERGIEADRGRAEAPGREQIGEEIRAAPCAIATREARAMPSRDNCAARRPISAPSAAASQRRPDSISSMPPRREGETSMGE
jgi:hypothetical protein